MIRELVTKINRTLTEHRVSRRRRHNVPIKVHFAPELNTANLSKGSDDSFLCGETIDVSDSGIGFVVPSIRIKEKYLVGQDRILSLELDMGGRKIRMQAMGMRYEKVGIHVSVERYFIGARIVGMSEEDERSFEYFLKFGNKLQNSPASASIGLELD